MTGFGDLNLKFPLILPISVLMSSLILMLGRSRAEHEKSFITSEPGGRRIPATMVALT